MNLFFSDYFRVSSEQLDEYGAFDISVVSDLPLFVDPFLLFNSQNATYQELHQEVLKYLRFLRDEADPALDPALIENWYRFKEVKQNWLGFTLFGNDGLGLGADFAFALHGALGDILSDFGNETVTRGTHLEKLTLIRPGVGRDNISDFTTNLIKAFLCEFTEEFARRHVDESQCAGVAVPRSRFNYQTKTWETVRYYLPKLRNDFVLLTPIDILTRDETWINYSNMIQQFSRLPDALPNAQLRAQVDRYFRDVAGARPTAQERRDAAAATIERFPQLIDLYIKLQEDDGDRAAAISAKKVKETERVLVEQIQEALNALQTTEFFSLPWSSYEECLARARYFKSYIEDNDGYRLFNHDGRPFATEKELQLAFGLVWCGSDFDVNREPNNGRGPVDFKASFGAGDKSLIEFKLASNTQLKRNLEKQVAIYETANRTRTSVKVIVCYTVQETVRVSGILRSLNLQNEESVIVIDARRDNKPPASKA